MTKTELKKMRDAVIAHCEKVAQNGGLLMTWDCPNCSEPCLHQMPTDELVGPKGYWDSATADARAYEKGVAEERERIAASAKLLSKQFSVFDDEKEVYGSIGYNKAILDVLSIIHDNK